MSRYLNLEELVGLVYSDSERGAGLREIQAFIRDERIPYAVFEDGILVPLGAFQVCMPALYDMELHL